MIRAYHTRWIGAVVVCALVACKGDDNPTGPDAFVTFRHNGVELTIEQIFAAPDTLPGSPGLNGLWVHFVTDVTATCGDIDIATPLDGARVFYPEAGPSYGTPVAVDFKDGSTAHFATMLAGYPGAISQLNSTLVFGLIDAAVVGTTDTWSIDANFVATRCF